MLKQEGKLQNRSRYRGVHKDSQPEGSIEIRKLGGMVYTPKVLADYVAHKVTELYANDQKSLFSPNELRVLDPACGKGELLDSIWGRLRMLLPPDKYAANDVLCGMDIDMRAISYTKDRISQLSAPRNPKTINTYLLNTNSLFPFNSRTSAQGWNRVKRKFNARHGFDIIIANPPWGVDISGYRDRISRAEFSVFRGQYDSSDLFLELAISNLRDGGYLAFIVPDSLFSQEREGLRKLLLDKTEIRFIGRFGEKFFGGINRACAVIICKKTLDKSRRKIQCLRLTPETRKKILAGKLAFVTAEKKLSHFVRRSRFEKNEGYRFNIDLTSNEETVLSRLSMFDGSLRDHIVGARGVELSKNGKVYECPTCNLWAPFPSSQKSLCPHCKTRIARDEVYSTKIVTKTNKRKYRPLIVGMCVQRYRISDNYWIDTSKQGINFKSTSTYKSPKILVRKTGVGISATLDYKNSLTNQVVYIFRPSKGNDIPLEFYLGVLSSRAIYYYIAKSHGEIEWRSHPYITQKQILDIPMQPIDRLHTICSDLVGEIASIVRKYTRTNRLITNEDDARIERAIAKLYGLHKSDYEVIFQALRDAEDLVPVRALKRIDIDMIFDEWGE